MLKQQSSTKQEISSTHKTDLEKSSDIEKINSKSSIEVKSDMENSVKGLSSEIPKNENKISKKWSKTKIGLIFGLVLCLIGVGTFCAIYFTMDHSRIQTKLMREGSGEVLGKQITYQQFSVQVIYKDNTSSDINFFVMQQKNVPVGRVLDETGTQKQVDVNCYIASVNNDETHRFCDNQNSENPDIFRLESFMNGHDLINQIKDPDQSDSQRLLQGQSNQQDVSINKETGEVKVANENISSFISQLHEEEGINLQFNLLASVDIQNHKSTDYGNNGVVITQKMENLINPETQANSPLPENGANLNNRRILRWRLKKIFKSVVKIIKKSAPYIGAVIGGAVGVFGGPVGILEGMQIGYGIGSALQTVANDCLPTSSSGNVKIKCNVKSLAKDAIVSVAASYTSNIIDTKYQLTANGDAWLKKSLS